MVCVGCGYETIGKNQPRYACSDCVSIQDVDVRRYCLHLDCLNDSLIPAEILIVPDRKPYGGTYNKWGFVGSNVMWSQ